jgi:glycerol-3-phosphate O-acyltransferase
VQEILKTTLAPIIPDITEWPIYKLSADKEAFLSEIKELTILKIRSKIHTEKELNDMLGKVLYSERIRLTQKAWKADPSDEREFWATIKNELLNIEASELQGEITADSPNLKIVHQIIDRYLAEIVGNFKPGMYNFARKSINVLVSKILNAAPGNRFRFWKTQKTIGEKLIITGELEKIRKLGKEATIVLVPTHFSNLDSIIMGYIIDRIGLPAVTYGAGLNLFSIKLLSYFMSNLGAFKVDRRKKNSIYLELIKNYSTVSLQRGANGLFFPGGTRSRSGNLEKNLKLGLLGTTLEAQRNLIEHQVDGAYKKIYILPVVLNYHFVLEASGLIEDYLKSTGKDKYIRENDAYSTSYKIVKFITKFLFANSEMVISLGPLLDVIGNEVDDEGVSIDHLGRKVDLKEYFTLNGNFKTDIQRENEYTRMLERSIVEKYYTHNTLLSSDLIAYVGFVKMKNRFPHLDLYAFLRLPEEDTEIPYDAFEKAVDNVKEKFIELNKNGKILLSEEIKLPTKQLIEHGLANMGVYHHKSVLKISESGNVISEDKKLLFYYHNRADGYQLEKYV